MSSNMTAQRNINVKNGSIDHTLLKILLTFILFICAGLLSIFGIVGNIVNIFNFRKQGLQDSVNVTLTLLAVSDVGCLLFQVLINVFWGYGDMPFSESAGLLIFYPHTYFSRVSGYITAFAAFERCLCVVLPLKVKTIITRKVAIVVNCGIFIVLTMYLFPIYYICYLDFRYNPVTNRTVLTLLFRDNAEDVNKIMFFVKDLLLPYFSFLILVLCTTFLIISLKPKAKWRRSLTAVSISQSASNSKITSTKEKKTSVMLTTVSVIYIACLTPSCAIFTAVGVFEELNADGAYFDLGMLVFSVATLLETVNCCLNTLVYYKMSSKFRDIIHEWFPLLRRLYMNSNYVRSY